MIGKVIWFNNAKGYGFLLDSATNKEYFCHYSSILCNGYKQLTADQKVEFDLEIGKSSGREQAGNVVVVD
jgi:CspA family cold shock protein